MYFTIFTWIEHLASVGKKANEIPVGEPVVQPLFGREQWEKNLAEIGCKMAKTAEKGGHSKSNNVGIRKTGFAFIQWQENHPQLPMFHKS